jgi:uncharacterized membrane protein
MKKTEVIELEMSVDEALKYIISMGVVSPNDGNASISPNTPQVLKQNDQAID